MIGNSKYKNQKHQKYSFFASFFQSVFNFSFLKSEENLDILFEKSKIISATFDEFFNNKNGDCLMEIFEKMETEWKIAILCCLQSCTLLKNFLESKKTVFDFTLIFNMVCQSNNNIQIIKYLVEKIINKTNINLKDSIGKTPLHYASFNSNKNIKIIKCLIENKAELNTKDKHGANPFHYACLNKSFFTYLKYLVETKFDLNSTDNNGRTALHYACSNNSITPKIIKYLIENNANLYSKDNHGFTPFHLACKYNQNLEITKFLISCQK